MYNKSMNTNDIDLSKADHKQIVDRIKERRKALKRVSCELKKHFVGLDSIIDRIIKNIEVWYVMPELLTRPVIICLWGPTGVGKTDLVRRLVKLLGFHDRFCEVEMMNKGNSTTYPWHSSISSILGTNPKIESGKPCVLLMDEIQNFRTINEDGHELSEYKFRDIWTLLSDGKLPFHVDLDYLLQLLWEYDDKEKKEKEGKSKKRFAIPEKAKIKRDATDDDEIEGLHPDSITDNDLDPFGDDSGSPKEVVHGGLLSGIPITDDDDDDDDDGPSYYNLKHFKTTLRLTESLEEIAKWTTSKKKSIIIEKLSDQNLYEEVDYTRSLIFISGNLDEAYEFAKKTNEVDVDADIFHQISLKINLLDIKKALMERFKPEQIARFGNTQVIYPTLSKKSYEKIIARKIAEIVKNVERRCNVKMGIDSSINRLVYENGVFPTQGTRPVFSTISEIIEAPLPPFLLSVFSKQKRVIKISYADGHIRGEVDGSIFKYPYRGALDKLKEDRNKNIDRRVLNAVHEAGHAIVYAVLFKYSPPQISSRPASQEIGGFIWVHEICGAKKMIENKICTILSGGAAERMVFGKNNATWGLQEDLHEATKLAGAMAKRYGMEEFSSFIMHPQRSDIVNTDVNSANPLIEKIVAKFAQQAEDMLREWKALFQDTVDCLLKNKNLSTEDFQKICAKHSLKIKVRKSEETIYSDYHRQYLSFKNLP